MFLFYFLACQNEMESLPEIYSFLDQVVNVWWHLEIIDDNFYLERKDEDDLTGLLYLDYVNGPMDILEYNVLEGDWFYDGNGQFSIVDNEESYSLSVKAIDNNCYKISYIYKLMPVSDIACLL